LLVGFFGYGGSLVLFVLALRQLGTGRTGAYFATAPFIAASGRGAVHRRIVARGLQAGARKRPTPRNVAEWGGEELT
jgi:drug/metabolite transporter (DMT)-like permease